MLILGLVAAGAIGVLAGPAAARDGSVTSFDGTKIVYSFFPDPALKPGQKAPTVMFGPGYSSARSGSSDATVQGLLANGYNVLTWDPRGFGDSTGNVELDSPAYEARDVSALIGRIAQQPEAQLDRPGDPRVGMVGASYGGGIQLTSAEIDPRIDVIAPQISWNSLITALDKSNTAKGGWGGLLAVLGAQGSTTGGLLGGLMGEPAGAHVTDMQDPRIYQALEDGLTTGEFTPADEAFFASAGPAPLLSHIHIPVLLMQATDDTLFTLHEAITNYEALQKQHVPLQMLWFCGSLSDNPGVAHGQCLTPKGPDPKITLHFELRWLARYLKRETGVSTGPGFTWISDAGTERTAPGYPPAPGPPLTGSGSGILPLVPGDTSGELIVASHAANAVNVPLNTPAAGTELVGEPTLTMNYSGTSANPDGRLYAQILSNANGLVLGNQVTPLPVTLDGANHTLTIPLEGVAADASAGSTYTLQITDGTSVYFAARSAGLVNLSHISVSVPTVAPGASGVVTGITPSGASSAAPPRRRAGAHLAVRHVRAHATRNGCTTELHEARDARLLDRACSTGILILSGTISRRADHQRLTVAVTTVYHGRAIERVSHPRITRGRFTARLRLPGGQTDAFANPRRDRGGQPWRYRVHYAGSRTLLPATASGRFTLEVEPRGPVH
ncbi:MAG TPA: alpha/beta fold hydrolase [Solirubrobacteraceae bacterium]|nr:alpha/beta fold hydrolase [Solirubrobacteraceae bacterium]